MLLPVTVLHMLSSDFLLGFYVSYVRALFLRGLDILDKPCQRNVDNSFF